MRPSTDFDDKKAKGLCFWCDEKFVIGQCKKKQLYVIEVNEENEMEDETNEKVEEGWEDLGDLNHHILVYAISEMALKEYMTIKVTIYVKKRPLHILIDLESTHNFLNIDMAKKLGYKMEKIGLIRVDVANGSSLARATMSRWLFWTLQRSRFTIDVLLLPLGSCDMVLGIQWLETLWKNKWDFKHFRIKFEIDGKKHGLRRGSSPIEFKTVNVKTVG